MNWALDKVRVREQNEWHAYDRKKCKKKRYVFHKTSHKLKEADRWYLDSYFSFSSELKAAYELKEEFYQWFYASKEKGPKHIKEIKEGLNTLLEKMDRCGIPELIKTAKTAIGKRKS